MNERRHTVYVVVGLGYGDEGKGAVVDFLTRTHGAGLVVRYNGGPQAAHHVVDPEGRTHCFSQLPAGLMTPDVRGVLADTMLIDPPALMRENDVFTAAGFADGLARLTIDPACLVITPWQRALGRMREVARGSRRHGSCGMGVGQTVHDAAVFGEQAPRAADLLSLSGLEEKARFVRLNCLDRAEQLLDAHPDQPHLAEMLRDLGDPAWLPDWVADCEALLRRRPGLIGPPAAAATAIAAQVATTPVICEGAHGVLLDRTHGFWPFVTKTVTTTAPAFALLARLDPPVPSLVIGVTRAYTTRHGPGPFVTESTRLTELLPDTHNKLHPWQGPFRVGWLDAVALRYAVAVNGGIDRLAVTHLDRVTALPEICFANRYRLSSAKGRGDTIDGRGPDDFFVFGHDETVITAIRPTPDPEPAHQQLLARWLRHCEPVWQRTHGLTPDACAATIAGLVGAPISVMGLGPTHRDYRWSEPAEVFSRG